MAKLFRESLGSVSICCLETVEIIHMHKGETREVAVSYRSVIVLSLLGAVIRDNLFDRITEVVCRSDRG